MLKGLTTLFIVAIVTFGSYYLFYHKNMLQELNLPSQDAQVAISEQATATATATQDDASGKADRHIEPERSFTDFVRIQFDKNPNLAGLIADVYGKYSSEKDYMELTTDWDTAFACYMNYYFWSSDNYNKIGLEDLTMLEGCLDDGAPVVLHMAGVSLLDSDSERALTYLRKAAEAGYTRSYYIMADYYFNNAQDELCDVVNEAFYAYGYAPFFAFANDVYEILPALKLCGVPLPEGEGEGSILAAIDSPETRFYLAQHYIEQENTDGAYSLLTREEDSVSVPIQVNRDYCVGMFEYYINGNQEKGIEFLKEAFDRGMLMAGVELADIGEELDSEFPPFPDTDLYFDLPGNMCGILSNKEQDENSMF